MLRLEKSKSCSEDMRAKINSLVKELVEGQSRFQGTKWVLVDLSRKQMVTEHSCLIRT